MSGLPLGSQEPSEPEFQGSVPSQQQAPVANQADGHNVAHSDRPSSPTWKGSRDARLNTLYSKGRSNSGTRLRFNQSKISNKVQAALQQFDIDNNGALDMDELVSMAEYLIDGEKKVAMLRGLVIALSIAVAVLLAGTFGLTWAVVAALKDTRFDSGSAVMLTKGGNVVQTASADYTLNNNMFVVRTSANASATTTNTSSEPAVVRTAAFTGTRREFASYLDITQLMEMNYLVISNGAKGEVALRVHGVGRVPRMDSYWGTVVRVLTTAGTITLDDTQVLFEESIAPIFEEAGFIVDASRRRLLQDDSGSNPIAGLFNYINQHAFEFGPMFWKITAKSKADAASQTSQLGVVSNKTNAAQQEADYLAGWNAFKRLYGKAWNATEEAERYVQFRDALDQVLAVNSNPNVTYWASANRYSDMTFEEFIEQFTGFNVNETSEYNLFNTSLVEGGRRRLLQAAAAPSVQLVDWRTSGKVTPVKDQGSCGSCWAFAGTGALESSYAIAMGVDASTVDFSEEFAASCGYATSNGCNGGLASKVFALAYRNYTTTEKIAPYTSSTTKTCSKMASLNPPDSSKYRFADAGTPVTYENTFTDNENRVLNAIAQRPAAMAMAVTKSFMNYAGGIYSNNVECATTAANHAMLFVGYNITGKYLIIKNSWGAGWGEKGYARVSMTGTNAGLCKAYQYVDLPPSRLYVSAPPPPAVTTYASQYVTLRPYLNTSLVLRTTGANDFKWQQVLDTPATSTNERRFLVQPVATVSGVTWSSLTDTAKFRCMDVEYSSTDDLSAIMTWDCDTQYTSQQWRFEAGPNGTVRLIARHSGKCLDNTGSTLTGGVLMQTACNGSPSQLFTATTATAASGKWQCYNFRWGDSTNQAGCTKYPGFVWASAGGAKAGYTGCGTCQCCAPTFQ